MKEMKTINVDCNVNINEPIKVHYNFKEQKWNLIVVDEDLLRNATNKGYYLPKQAYFIDPTKSKLVRVAWKIHCFFQRFKCNPKQKDSSLSAFLNPSLGTDWESPKKVIIKNKNCAVGDTESSF